MRLAILLLVVFPTAGCTDDRNHAAADGWHESREVGGGETRTSGSANPSEPFEEARLVTVVRPIVAADYDINELNELLGKEIEIVGQCGNANVRSASISVSLRDGQQLSLRLGTAWPHQIRNEYETCGHCDLCAQVKGVLRMHDGELYFSSSEVLGFWRCKRDDAD